MSTPQPEVQAQCSGFCPGRTDKQGMAGLEYYIG